MSLRTMGPREENFWLLLPLFVPLVVTYPGFGMVMVSLLLFLAAMHNFGKEMNP